MKRKPKRKPSTPDWYYLSFCDGDKPKGQQFLGGCYVQANPEMAIDDHPNAIAKGVRGGGSSAPVLCSREAWRLGINPGGQVACWGPLPEKKMPAMEWRNRLMTKEQLMELHEMADIHGKTLT